MFENRLQAYFSPSLPFAPSIAPATSTEKAREFPYAPVGVSDIYQAAFERARLDYELNRLFNPDYYQDGSGI